MHRFQTLHPLLAAGLLGLLTLAAGFAQDRPGEASPKSAAPPLIIIDAAGKEQKLKTWKIVQGTRRLAWLASPAEEPEPKGKEPARKAPARAVGGRGNPAASPASGPLALAFREENSTTFVNGVLTLIPLDRLQSLDFDSEKQLATAKVELSAMGLIDAPREVILTGTTKYEKINKITIEAEVDEGDLGVAEVRFLGGVSRGGIRGLRFPDARKATVPPGRPATVTIQDKGKKTEMPVVDLQALYRLGTGGEVLSPLLFFKKTLKLEVAKIQKIASTESDNQDPSWQVTLKDGNEKTLTLLQAVTLDGKPATLEGLLGRVPAGYKLFPIHTIGEVEFEPSGEK